MLPGWSQTAALFKGQFETQARIGRVVALDHRGHGDSEKPAHGYRVQRLAKDLFELLAQLEIYEPAVIAHSLGVSVTWSYLSLFGAERPLGRLVLVDEPRALLARPHWSEQERARAGAILPSLEAMGEFVEAVGKADTPESLAEILRPMFTVSVSESLLLQVARENLKFPRPYACRLLADNIIQDWGSVIERIISPTLVMVGEATVHPVASQKWIAETVAQGELCVVPAGAGGSHFLFLENPGLFNERVLRFLG